MATVEQAAKTGERDLNADLALIAELGKLSREELKARLLADSANIAAALINAIRSNPNLRDLEGLLTNTDIMAVAQTDAGVAMLVGFVNGDLTMKQAESLAQTIKNKPAEAEVKLAEFKAGNEEIAWQIEAPLGLREPVRAALREVPEGKINTAFEEREITRGQQTALLKVEAVSPVTVQEMLGKIIAKNDLLVGGGELIRVNTEASPNGTGKVGYLANALGNPPGATHADAAVADSAVVPVRPGTR